MPAEMRPFEPSRDASEIGELLNLSFGDWGTHHGRSLKKLARSQWKNERCLVEDGRIVAFLEVKPLTIYIGRALLRMAGIAVVCTHPVTRMKGHGRVLFDDTIAFMERQRYDISLLYGIPNYYHKFGYEVVMSRYFTTVEPSAIHESAETLSRGAIGGNDLRAIHALYKSQTRFRDGNCLRKSMDRIGGGVKLSDNKGRIMAYAYWRPADGTMNVDEAISRDAASAKELLTALRRIAAREGLTNISVQMPYGYHVTDALRGVNSVSHRADTYRRGCMGRVMNMASLARKMQDEWRALVRRSELASKSGSVSLGVGEEVLSIAYDGGRVSSRVGKAKATSRVSQERFIQMVHGYRSIADISGGPDARIATRDMRALEVLFPLRNAFLFAGDQF